MLRKVSINRAAGTPALMCGGGSSVKPCEAAVPILNTGRDYSVTLSWLPLGFNPGHLQRAAFVAKILIIVIT